VPPETLATVKGELSATRNYLTEYAPLLEDPHMDVKLTALVQAISGKERTATAEAAQLVLGPLSGDGHVNPAGVRR
jgi:hypothetical protein